MIEIIYCMFGLALALLIIHELLEIKKTRLKNKVWQARLDRMKKDEQNNEQTTTNNNTTTTNSSTGTT